MIDMVSSFNSTPFINHFIKQKRISKHVMRREEILVGSQKKKNLKKILKFSTFIE
jgi:hypothetical protein